MPRTLIIDDEAHARTTLRQMLARYCPQARVIGEADGVADGIAIIQATQPDVVFLDIQMKDGTGFDLLCHFPQPKFGIVFTTAFDQFALKAFEYYTIDYLVKPIGPDELCRSIGKALANQSQQLYAELLSSLKEAIQSQKVERIALSTSEGLIFLRLKELIRLESSGSYTTFFLCNGSKAMVSRTLREFEELLPSDTFFRIHQSHIVNINYVQSILREDGGYALMEDKAKVPISRRKKEAFLYMLAGISLA